MTKTSRRHTMKMMVSATMFHTALPPCTANTLNARISSPAREACVFSAFSDTTQEKSDFYQSNPQIVTE